MPELLEVEVYRQRAEAAVGRRIESVHAPDAWFLKRGLTAEVLADAVGGATIEGVRRHGKLLVVDLVEPGGDARPGLGLHFGMTGRLLVDGIAAIDQLVYDSRDTKEAWVRLRLGLGGGGAIELHDPRRLGAVELDPDLSRLGPDAASLGLRDLRSIVGRSRAPIKAVLLDQSRVAGIGNLLADEVLWFAGVDPTRSATSLDDGEVRALSRAIRRTVDLLGRRGGSHRGDTFEHRVPGGRCPRDDAEMVTAQVGGRTTWWCSQHQR